MLDLKNLLSNWIGTKADQVMIGFAVKDIWCQDISPSTSAVFSEINQKDKEIVIEVSNHLLLSDLQFQKVMLLNKLNEKLKEKNMEEFRKIRFRLKLQ